MPRLSLLRATLVAALCLLSASAARSQVAVYGSAGIASFYVVDSFIENEATVGTGMVGAFYNFPIQSRFTAGIDARTVYSPGSHGGDFTGAALRFGFVPHKFPLRPYLQIGGGVVHTTAKFYSLATPTGTVVYNNKAFTNGALELAFGLDVRLTHHLDWRAFDYGAAAAGGSSTNPTGGMAFLTTGAVYHF